MTDTQTTGAVLDRPDPNSPATVPPLPDLRRPEPAAPTRPDPRAVAFAMANTLHQRAVAADVADPARIARERDAVIERYVAGLRRLAEREGLDAAVKDLRGTFIAACQRLAWLDRRATTAASHAAREQAAWDRLRAAKYAAEGWDACPDRGHATPGGLLGALAAAGLIALAGLTLLLVTSPAEAPTGRPAPAPTATTATPTPDEYTADQLVRIIAEERRTP